ncbi:MAG: transglutaminase domain-containing protein [Anaerovoracaceae bacterium]|nr:transglutaminase domain-containing protein [Bacillota bacterium]MDY2670103.1 transglutaminase domain-containing protein [Anaerovoracaceae bacterium]
MSELIRNLSLRKKKFNIAMGGLDRYGFEQAVTNELIDNPAVTASIAGFSAGARFFRSGRIEASFEVSYEPVPKGAPVFQCRDQFELDTAVSTALRLHLPDIIILIDNRSRKVDPNRAVSLYRKAQEFVGEELQTHQSNSTGFGTRALFDGAIIVLKIHNDYFDSARDVNAMSCLLAIQADAIVDKTRGNTEQTLNEIMYWMRENVVYKKTRRTSDHSAVGLIKNHTAVCQGIAAYACQLLNYCGIDARYVSGQGFSGTVWDSHGWNMVKVNGVWRHIDYTFELGGHSASIIKPAKEFCRDHRWDRNIYSPERSDRLVNSRNTLRRSVLTFMPDRHCFSINGCIVDTSHFIQMCLVRSGRVMVAPAAVAAMLGGCYVQDRRMLHLYIRRRHYAVPNSSLLKLGGVLYTDMINLKDMDFRIMPENGFVSIQYQL